MNKANLWFSFCLLFMYIMGYLVCHFTNKYFKDNEDDIEDGSEIQKS